VGYSRAVSAPFCFESLSGGRGGGSLDKVPRWACSVSPCTVKFVMLEADLPRSVRLARSEEMLMVVPEGLLLAFQPGRFQAA